MSKIDDTGLEPEYWIIIIKGIKIKHNNTWIKTEKISKSLLLFELNINVKHQKTYRADSDHEKCNEKVFQPWYKEEILYIYINILFTENSIGIVKNKTWIRK